MWKMSKNTSIYIAGFIGFSHQSNAGKHLNLKDQSKWKKKLVLKFDGMHTEKKGYISFMFERYLKKI